MIAHARTDYVVALSLFQDALALAKEMDYRQGEAAQLENVAGCLMLLNQFHEAEAALLEALPIEQETGNQYGFVLVMADLSYVKLLQGDMQMALEYLERAWPIAHVVGGPDLLARLYWSQADIHAAMGEKEMAYREYINAIEYVEVIRGNLLRESDRASFITTERARVFGKLVLFLQQKCGRSEEAINYAERARSRLFLEQLSSNVFSSTLAILRSEPLSYEQIRDFMKHQQ